MCLLALVYHDEHNHQSCATCFLRPYAVFYSLGKELNWREGKEKKAYSIFACARTPWKGVQKRVLWILFPTKNRLLSKNRWNRRGKVLWLLLLHILLLFPPYFLSMPLQVNIMKDLSSSLLSLSHFSRLPFSMIPSLQVNRT